MRTVKGCERYDTVRKLLLLHELPVPPSLHDQMSCACDKVPRFTLNPCKLTFSSYSPGPKVPKSPPLSPSQKALCFLILHVFTAHTFFTSDLLSPNYLWKMSAGCTMPPVPAPLLLPEELLVPYALHPGNWICSSHCGTYLHAESAQSKPWAPHLSVTACQHLPLALTLAIWETPASDEPASPDSLFPPGHPILFSISLHETSMSHGSKLSKTQLPIPLSPTFSTSSRFYRNRILCLLPHTSHAHSSSPESYLSFNSPRSLYGDFHSAVSPTPLKFHNTYISVFIWQLSCLTPLCYSY